MSPVYWGCSARAWQPRRGGAGESGSESGSEGERERHGRRPDGRARLPPSRDGTWSRSDGDWTTDSHRSTPRLCSLRQAPFDKLRAGSTGRAPGLRRMDTDRARAETRMARMGEGHEDAIWSGYANRAPVRAVGAGPQPAHRSSWRRWVPAPIGDNVGRQYKGSITTFSPRGKVRMGALRRGPHRAEASPCPQFPHPRPAAPGRRKPRPLPKWEKECGPERQSGDDGIREFPVSLSYSRSTPREERQTRTRRRPHGAHHRASAC